MNYFDFSIITTRWLELFSCVYVYHMRFSVGAWDTLKGRRKEASLSFHWKKRRKSNTK